MPRQLLAADRYPCRPEVAAFIEEVREYRFEVAAEFYDRFTPKMTASELALLGCNDRYFLLTWLCNRRDAVHRWLYERCREVEKNPDGRIDLWSREHYKTTLIGFAGVIQEILCDPEITIGIFSHTSSASRKLLGQIKRELESNEKLLRLYPDLLWRDAKERKHAASWSESTGITVKRQSNPKELTVEAHGLIDSMPTGRHFRLMLFDDVITQNEVTNSEMIAKVAERFQLADNLGQAEGSRRQIVGTRYSYGDYYGEMLAGGIAIARIHPATDDGTPDGNPVFWTRETWERKKRIQRTTMAAQLLQNPLAGKEQTFRVPWLKPYYVRPRLMNVYIMGDPSHGHNKTSDRTAIVAVGIDSEGIDAGSNKYLLDGHCHRMQLQERWARTRDLHKRWSNMPGVNFVKVGWERYGLQSDLDYFLERMAIERYSFPIEELNWTGERGGESKKYRVGRLEPDFRDGNFFVPWKVWHPRVAPKLDADGNPILLTDGLPDLGPGVARWFLKDGDDDIHLEAIKCPHAEERRCKSAGENWRVMDDGLRRLDEDKNIYDLTRVFFEEYRRFPLAAHDDLIDAMSRIHDMEPSRAVPWERIEVEDFPDA